MSRGVLPLGAILFLQLALAWGRIQGPFLDTRIHWNYDNAYFTSSARDGNLNGDLRSQFGVTRNTYVSWNERTGAPSYYTDHPFLVKAFFQQVTRLAGYGEAVSRVFSLAVSFLIAAGLYTIVLLTTGSALAAFAGAATLVLTPLFGTYQTCVKFESDGMLLGVWQFAALLWYGRRRSRGALLLFALLTAAAFLAHWTSAVSASLTVAVVLWDARFRPAEERWRLRAAACLAAVAGLALTLGLMVFLQGGLREAWAPLEAAVARRSQAIAMAEWLTRQWIYARYNFTVPLLVVLLLWLIGAALVGLSRRPAPRGALVLGDDRESLPVFIGVSFVTACVWQLLFRQGSFIHVYWQYWFALPAAAAVGAIFAALRSSRRALVPGLLLWGALSFHLWTKSVAAGEMTVASQLGTKADVEFLSGLRNDRFQLLVFVPYSVHPFNEWFSGPLFEYYTRRPVVVAGPERGLNPGEKVLILKTVDRAQVRTEIESATGVRLAGEKCGDRICAYDVLSSSS